jgi:hypothetical protein
MGSGYRVWFSALALTATALTSMIVSCSASAHLAPGGNPCAMIGSSKIESALGLTHSDQTPYIREAGPSGGVAYARCNFRVWSGGLPKTQEQATHKIETGTFGGVAVETWVPAPGPQEPSWTTMGYGLRLDGQVRGCGVLEKNPHGHAVSLPLDGAQGSFGAVGFTVGENVCGVWHRGDSNRIITVDVKETPHRNAVRDFKKITNILVSNFW